MDVSRLQLDDILFISIIMTCCTIFLVALKMMFKNTPLSLNLQSSYKNSSGILSPYKMVLVVRTDLSMGKGKIAAQCCHAAIAAYTKTEKSFPEKLKIWKYNGQQKVVLKVNGEDELLMLKDKAKKIGVVAVSICDAGRTQVPPSSLTALAIGPDESSVIDKVTGELKLL